MFSLFAIAILVTYLSLMAFLLSSKSARETLKLRVRAVLGCSAAAQEPNERAQPRFSMSQGKFR